MDKKRLIFIFLSGVFLIFSILLIQRPDGKIHLIVCDVGQGDAILIKTPRGDQILVDGGPDRRVLSCLGKFLPFWDRKIEAVILTHPQADHMVGLIEVLRRYQVPLILKTSARNQTKDFEAWSFQVEEEKANVLGVAFDDLIDLGNGLKMEILWPKERQFAQSLDLNETSIVLELSWANFCAVLTGDATSAVLNQIASKLESCPILKVAHHGSKNSLSESFLNQVKPKMALISAGKNNRFGHPHKEVLEELGKRSVLVKRTDRDSDIEVVSDGTNWYIK